MEAQTVKQGEYRHVQVLASRAQNYIDVHSPRTDHARSRAGQTIANGKTICAGSPFDCGTGCACFKTGAVSCSRCIFGQADANKDD
jgi:hypothetical protein